MNNALPGMENDHCGSTGKFQVVIKTLNNIHYECMAINELVTMYVESKDHYSSRSSCGGKDAIKYFYSCRHD